MDTNTIETERERKRKARQRTIIIFILYLPLWIFLLLLGFAIFGVALTFSRSIGGKLINGLPMVIGLVTLWYTGYRTMQFEKADWERKHFAKEVAVNIGILLLVILGCIAWIYLVFPAIS